MKNRLLLTLVTLLCAAIFPSPSWAGPATVLRGAAPSGPIDGLIRTNGTQFAAANFGSITSVTRNGVPFPAAGSFGNPAGVNWSTVGPNVDSNLGGDIATDPLFFSEIWNANPVTLTCSNLDPAKTYVVQVLHGEPRACCAGTFAANDFLTSAGATIPVPQFTLGNAIANENPPNDLDRAIVEVELTGITSFTYRAYSGVGRGGSIAGFQARELPMTSVVTTTADSGAGSLRQALLDTGADGVITIAAALSGQAITLTSGQLSVNKSVSLDASALPGGFTLNGNAASRIIEVFAGVSLSLNSLTLTNGVAAIGSYGGAILTTGTLSLANCTLSGNSAPQGGAMQITGGECSLVNCTLAFNTATGNGGAIDNSFNAGTLALTHCTVFGNTSGGNGAGIANYLRTLALTNTIVAGNTGLGGDIVNFANSTVVRSGANLVQSFINQGTDSGPAAITSAPRLAPLANYGGPTQTMPPLPGSPALNVAATTGLTTDQRGLPRVNGPGPDLGAVEANWPTDTFGYSRSPAAFTFEDISATGTRVLVNADTNGLAAPIGFAFGFYGRSYATASLTENGLITLGGENNVTPNRNLTTSAPIGNFPSIAVLWDQWQTLINRTPRGDAVYYQTLGAPGDRRFVVQWNDVFGYVSPTTGSPSGVTFQAILFEASGNILCQYRDVDSGDGFYTGGVSATVGIRDTDGQLNGKNLQWSYNQPVIANNQAILFAQVATDPDILTQPLSRTNVIGTTATFAVTASGSAGQPLAYEWQTNGVALADGGNVSGATTATLTLSNVTAADAALRYTVAVTNAVGRAVSAVATLTVRAPQAFVVTTTADAGAGSLRQAVAEYLFGDTLTFAPALAGQTIQLTSGQLVLKENLTLDASTLAGGIKIDGNATARIFEVAPNATVVLNSLTITNGLDLNATSTVTGTAGGGGGGGLRNGGTLTLNQCIVAGNSAVFGGGIRNEGTLTVNQSTLRQNSATGGNAPGNGGGINNAGTLALNLSTVSGNTAAGNGGGLRLASSGNVSLVRCTISGNTAPQGGGVSHQSTGTATLINCTLTGNNALNLGTGTQQTAGGAIIDLGSGLLSLNSCTLSGNGVDPASAIGGAGIYLQSPANVSLQNTIVAGNTALVGPDIRKFSGTLNRSAANLIGKNDTVAVEFPAGSPNGNGDLAGTTAAPLIAQLAALGTYGGPTRTMPPQPGSPAIDAGVNSALLPTIDQRGLPRPSGLRVDIGAAEVQVIIAEDPSVLTSMTVLGNGSFQFEFSNRNGAAFSVYASSDVSLPLSQWSHVGSAVESPPNSGQFRFTDPQAANIPHRFYYVRSP